MGLLRRLHLGDTRLVSLLLQRGRAGIELPGVFQFFLRQKPIMPLRPALLTEKRSGSAGLLTMQALIHMLLVAQTLLYRLCASRDWPTCFLAPLAMSAT